MGNKITEFVLDNKTKITSPEVKNNKKNAFESCMMWNQARTELCAWGQTPVPPYNLSFLCDNHVIPLLDWLLYHFETKKGSKLAGFFFSSNRQFMVIVPNHPEMFRIFHWINESTVPTELRFTLENGVCGNITDRYELLMYITENFLKRKEQFICDAILVVPNISQISRQTIQIMPSVYINAQHISQNDIQLQYGRLVTTEPNISPTVLLKPLCMVFSNSTAPDPRFQTGGVHHLWTYVSGHSTKHLKDKNFAVCRSPILYW